MVTSCGQTFKLHPPIKYKAGALTGNSWTAATKLTRRFVLMRQQHVSSQMAVTENSTSGIAYEYYYDYLDPVIVDERKLKYHKYSLVLIFWVVLAAFVLCLFLSLNLLSRSGNLPQTRTTSTNSLETRSE